MSIAALARDDVRALSLYAPDMAACAIDVSDNTNLWGAPPAARRALAEVPPDSIARYPSLYSAPLREARVAIGAGVPARKRQFRARIAALVARFTARSPGSSAKVRGRAASRASRGRQRSTRTRLGVGRVSTPVSGSGRCRDGLGN